jgi:hypothetical protein
MSESRVPELFPPRDERTARPSIDPSYDAYERRLIYLTQTLEHQLAAISLY